MAGAEAATPETVPVFTVESVDGAATGISAPGAATSVYDQVSVFVDVADGIDFAAAAGDGGVQGLLLIKHADAPDTFRFENAIPDGYEGVLQSDGSVAILGPDGAAVSLVAMPWAFDATGVAVPTWFELEGSTLVQTVDHTGGDYAYPIIADPWQWRVSIAMIGGLAVVAAAVVVAPITLSTAVVLFGIGYVSTYSISLLTAF